MLSFRLIINSGSRKRLEKLLKRSEDRGDLRTVKRVMAILAFSDNVSPSEICNILRVSEESIRLWIKAFLLKGVEGLKPKKNNGRPSNLTKSQRRELAKLIEEGPTKVGFPGACWRSPMIQSLIYEKFGVFYSVNYISQLLKNMGFSYQKAKFVSDHKNPEKRKEWLEKRWPEIVKLSEKKDSLILFGDEASFPQWGSLTYTWAKKGQQPVVKTSGIRKGYKVLGLIEYFSGRFFFKTHEGRLNSASYASFLEEVMSQTKKHLILIQDGAPYHTSKAMKEFFKKHSSRLTVYQLPSYSPDYNPIERLWKKIKEKEIHLHYFPTFDSLKDKVEEALLHFKDLKKEVLSLFVFYNELDSCVA